MKPLILISTSALALLAAEPSVAAGSTSAIAQHGAGNRAEADQQDSASDRSFA